MTFCRSKTHLLKATNTFQGNNMDTKGDAPGKAPTGSDTGKTDSTAAGMNPYVGLVSSLRAAWLTGKTRAAEHRVSQLEALGRFLDDKKQPILDAMASDMRKPPFEVELSEIIMVKNEVNYALNNLSSWMKDESVDKSLVTQLDTAFIRKEPYGVVLIIGPWNYPLQLILVPLVGAIAAGNCVIIKPSEISSSTEKLVAETLPRYLDKDCFAVVTGGPAETTQLLENKFDYIFFTGMSQVTQPLPLSMVPSPSTPRGTVQPPYTRPLPSLS
uniref:Aldehyde dehydrogenase domain-containing protein n=1 Tax=Terrapene triunguis TaxID=2587831 RepID=A0A674JIM5_9SAUR